ncbi:MAG: DUF1800 family protein, partial [Acidobacteria bacterium]|nr:DUF1800 family protein [Acidobacteriota bacterium]
MSPSVRKLRQFSRLQLPHAAIPAVILAIGLAALATSRDSDRVNAASLPSNDRAIAHVLNRVAFGPRPGDVDKVRQTGVAAYLEQQLHPERLDDGRLGARLASFKTLTLSSREIAEQYVLPFQQERRRLQQRAAQSGQPADPDLQTDPRMQAPALLPQRAGERASGPPAPDAASQAASVMKSLLVERVRRFISEGGPALG